MVTRGAGAWEPYGEGSHRQGPRLAVWPAWPMGKLAWPAWSGVASLSSLGWAMLAPICPVRALGWRYSGFSAIGPLLVTSGASAVCSRLVYVTFLRVFETLDYETIITTSDDSRFLELRLVSASDTNLNPQESGWFSWRGIFLKLWTSEIRLANFSERY